MLEITNYYQRAYSLLASQFQILQPDGTRTNFQKLLYAIITQAQSLQTQETLLYTLRNINDAQGVQLDGVGQILGLTRIDGQSDQDYREALFFQIFINSSSGTPEQVISALKQMTNSSVISYFELYPAAYLMEANATTSTIFVSNEVHGGYTFVGLGTFSFNIFNQMGLNDLYPNAYILPGSATNPLVLKIGSETFTDTTGIGIFSISPGFYITYATIDYTTGLFTFTVSQPFVAAPFTVFSMIYRTGLPSGYPANPSDLVEAIQNISPAGVEFIGIVGTYNTLPFAFSMDPYNEQLYVNPNLIDPTDLHPFQVNPGSGAVDLYVNRGQTENPEFGGGFAEAIQIGFPTTYNIDTTGAGQLAEAIMKNGNIPPTP